MPEQGNGGWTDRAGSGAPRRSETNFTNLALQPPGGAADFSRVGRADVVADFDGALAAARDGRAVGLDWLFRMVSQPLVSYVRAQGVWDPDGLANEVLLRALTQLHRFDGNESGFRSWVFSIARCRVIDERRGVGRRPRSSPSGQA